MNTGILAEKLKSIHAWRELAAFIYLPADVIWLTGWHCMLAGIPASQSMTGIFVIFTVMNCVSYILLRLLFNWQAPAALRLGLGALGLVLGLWLGENLLIYHALLFDFNKIFSDVWFSFGGVKALSAEFWSLACIIFIWVRNIPYTHHPVTQDTIMGRLQFGMFMLLILVLIYDKLDLALLLTGLCLFLIGGLTALGLARIADINLHRGGRRLPFSLDWFLAICGISTVLVFVSGALSVLTGSWLGLAVVAIMNGILTVIRYIVTDLIAPVLTIILEVLFRLVESFYHPQEQLKTPDLDLDPFRALEKAEPFKLVDPTAEGLKAAQPYLLGILLGLAAVVIVLMLLRIPLKEWLGGPADAGEKTEGNAWKQLRKSIGRRIQSLLDGIGKRVNIRRAVGLFRAARIRWIYHQLELYAERKGYPRPAALTPLEYQVMLEGVFPGGGEDLALITSAYQSVRYGELPETTREVTRVEESWEKLKSLKVIRVKRSTRRRRP
jgi:hypothetical protein